MSEITNNYATVRDDFFSQPLEPVENVHLMGSACAQCNEIFLGKVTACQNCQCQQISSVPLSTNGTLFSYTIVRNLPPGEYKGANNPFQPYPVGLVELPEGVRILSPLDCEIDALQVDMPLTLKVYPLYENDEDKPVLAYKFQAISNKVKQ